jgi:hypothetical protein
VKRLHDSRRLRKSLYPTSRRYLNERPERTTSCGQDPTLKGFPTERPEIITSCGLDPTLKGHPTKSTETTEGCGPESTNVFAQDFLCEKL